MTKQSKREFKMKYSRNCTSVHFDFECDCEKGAVRVSGYVSRGFDCARYYAASIAKSMFDDYDPDWDFVGPAETPFYMWNEDEVYDTVPDAIREHCLARYGVDVGDIALPEMPRRLVAVVRRTVRAWFMNEAFDGTKREHERLARQMANRLVCDECLYSPKYWACSGIVDVGLLNLDSEYALKEWELETSKRS